MSHLQTPRTLFIAINLVAKIVSFTSGAANAANCPGANCRLRDAIAAAASGDTIEFASPLFDSPSVFNGNVFLKTFNATVQQLPPTLGNYQNASITLSGNATVSPDAAPSGAAG